MNVVTTSSRIGRAREFNNQDFFDRSYYTIELVERIGGTIEVMGLENFAAHKGASVIVSNHMSLLETFLLPSLIIPFNPMCVVIKKELTEYPGFGKVMSDVNHIAVTRDNPRADFRLVMEQGLAYLQNGISVLIFPQSTRNPVFIPAEFNTLGEKLAAKAGVPVFPVAVKTDLHGTGRWIKDLGPVYPSRPVKIEFGQAIDPKDGRKAHEQVLDFVGGRLRGWGLPVQEAPAPAPDAPA